jgi:hypothetical protein
VKKIKELGLKLCNSMVAIMVSQPHAALTPTGCTARHTKRPTVARHALIPSKWHLSSQWMSIVAYSMGLLQYGLISKFALT